MAPLKKMKTKTFIIANNGYNMFEITCGIFRGGGGKNPLLSTTLSQFAWKKNLKFLFKLKKTTMTMGWVFA